MKKLFFTFVLALVCLGNVASAQTTPLSLTEASQGVLRIKTFSSHKPDVLDSEVNKWLDDMRAKKSIAVTIISLTPQQMGGGVGAVQYTVTAVYREINVQKK